MSQVEVTMGWQAPQHRRRSGAATPWVSGLALAVLVGFVAAGFMTGVDGFLVLALLAGFALWPLRWGRRVRDVERPSDAIDRFLTVGTLAGPLLREPEALDVQEVSGNARLLFVDVNGDCMIVDGLIAQLG